MRYVGIDVSKEKHYVVMKDRDRVTVDSFKFSNNMNGFMKAVTRMPKDAIIGLEATSEYHKPLVYFLRSRGYSVYVFNPRKTKSFGKVDHIRTKTDKVDADMLADFLIMGFHKTQKQPNSRYEELKQFTRARINLMNDQTRYKLRVLNRLAVVFPEYERLFSQNFGATFTKLLENYTVPRNFEELSTDSLGREIISASMGLLREGKAVEIIETARNSIGIREGIAGYIQEIRTNLRYIKELDRDIRRFDRIIRERMMGIEQKVTSIRGIDVTIAATIIAETGDINNFHSRKAYFNFTGMVPTIRESGKYKSRIREMSKHGSKYLRTAIWLGAISCINHNRVFKMYFIKKVYIDKKPKMVAIGAVCRKLTYNIYNILKNDVEFDTEKALYAMPGMN